MNAECYCETLQKLRWTSQNMRRGILRAGVVLLHYNVGHILLEDQNMSCKGSAGMYLIIHLIARTSRPLIFIFSYSSRNFCPVSLRVFRITKRRRSVSLSGSNPTRQNSTTQGYKSWSHGMRNFSLLEVNKLKITRPLLYLLQKIFPVNWGLFL